MVIDKRKSGVPIKLVGSHSGMKLIYAFICQIWMLYLGSSFTAQATPIYFNATQEFDKAIIITALNNDSQIEVVQLAELTGHADSPKEFAINDNPPRNNLTELIKLKLKSPDGIYIPNERLPFKFQKDESLLGSKSFSADQDGALLGVPEVEPLISTPFLPKRTDDTALLDALTSMEMDNMQVMLLEFLSPYHYEDYFKDSARFTLAVVQNLGQYLGENYLNIGGYSRTLISVETQDKASPTVLQSVTRVVRENASIIGFVLAVVFSLVITRLIERYLVKLEMHRQKIRTEWV